MIYRETNHQSLIETMQPYLHETVGFEPVSWLANPLNICLTNGEGDFSLFERELPHVVTGHYFFKSRGRQAVRIAREMLAEAFLGAYEIELIRGLTPLQKLGARWMNKQLGFKSYGVVQTLVGPCELVMLTKQEWFAGQEESN